MTLVVTDAGLVAVGIEPEAADSSHMGADEASIESHMSDTSVETASAPKRRTALAGTKQALLIRILRGDTGATVDEIVTATGWQPHTLRGAIAGAPKMKRGLAVASENEEGRGRVYRHSRA